MKIITYNIRGLGRGVKWAAIRRMIRKERADMLCLQETKKEHLDNYICHALWGDTNVKWKMQPVISRAGGLLCLWNESSFRLDRKVCGQGFIYLEGIWVPDGQRMVIVNIYVPCDMIQKGNLWDQITQLKALNPGVLWCILGDFNSIRTAEERVGMTHPSYTT